MDWTRPRIGRTKQVPRKKGKIIQPVTQHRYDCGSDSEDSKFSQSEHNHSRNNNREDQRRNKVTEQLEQSQREKHQQWEAQRVQDLTGDETPKQNRTFDGVSLDSNEKTRKMKEQLAKQNLTINDVGDSIGHNNSKAQKKSRGKKQTNSNSLSNLDRQSSRRILSKDRNNDPLDVAMALQSNYHVNASEFRKRSNFTSKMGKNSDRIFSNSSQQRVVHENPAREYGKYNGGSTIPHRRKQRQKEPVDVQKQNHPMARIPKKQKPQQEVVALDCEDSQGFVGGSSSFMDVDYSNLTEINNFDNSKTFPKSTGKRKQRVTNYDQLEMAETITKLSSRTGPKSPVDSGKDTTGHSDMMEFDSDAKMSDAQETPTDDDIDAIVDSVAKHDVWSLNQSFNRTSKESRGRSNAQFDYETRQSPLESETKLNLIKANNPRSAKKKGGKPFDRSRFIDDELVDYESDSDGRKLAAGGKKRDSDATKKRLKQNRMVVDTPTDRATKSTRNKRNKTPSTMSTLDDAFMPRRSRRRSRLKAKIEGSTNDNAIKIDDSSSDESSVGKLPIEGPSSHNINNSQGEEQTFVRAIGDLAEIDVARIAVGKKVFKSRCTLKFQWGTRRPYMLFGFSINGSKSVEIKVPFKGEDLKELAYHVAYGEESDEYDSSMSVVAFCIMPNENNKLHEFSKWYNGELDDASGMKYITMELRDKEQFQDMLTTMAGHPDLKAFYDGSKIKLHDLDSYIGALVDDDIVEAAKRHNGPRTRSGGKNKTFSRSENKLLVVYPFDVENEKLYGISSHLKELGGDSLGIADSIISKFTTDDDETDIKDECNENSVMGCGYLTIREDDKERLEPGQFLNDTLVDFWMSWISRQHRSNCGSNRVHFFTSHFLSTVAEDGPEGVASWTQNKKRTIHVFEKKFIFVPVNADLHWSLCVIVNPGNILKAHENNQEHDSEVEEWPCILFLDSLKMHRKNKVAKIVRKWLNFEWNRTKNQKKRFVEKPFTDNHMKLVAPRVPYQENGCDCGVFVCRYAYNLFLMRNQIFSRQGIKDHFKQLITDGSAFQFGMDDIARIREEMKALVCSLTPLYAEFKQKQKALKAAKKEEKTPKGHTEDEGTVSEEKENSPIVNVELANEETKL